VLPEKLPSKIWSEEWKRWKIAILNRSYTALKKLYSVRMENDHPLGTLEYAITTAKAEIAEIARDPKLTPEYREKRTKEIKEDIVQLEDEKLVRDR
jgi:hypothetical protein